MHSRLLRAIVAEAEARLVEQELTKVQFVGALRYVLRFAAAHESLLISLRPDLPRMHLLSGPPGKPRDLAPDRFAARLDEELGGAVLEDIRQAPGDRIVEMVFRKPEGPQEKERLRLMVHLFGRAADAHLLDPSGIILASAVRSAAESGRTESETASARYAPPPPPASEKEPPAAGDPAAGWQALVRSTRPLDAYREGDDLVRDEIAVEVHPVAGGTQPTSGPAAAGPAGVGLASFVRSFSSPSAAAQAAFDLIERLRDFKTRRDHHAALIQREIGRLETTEARLAVDLEKAKGAETYRRWGEALLAGLPRVVVAGPSATVPDPLAPDGPPLTIPIDPARSLQENAQQMFDRYKKGKRGVQAIEQRRQVLRARRESWSELRTLAAGVRTLDDLDRLRERMERLGLAHADRPRKSAAPPPLREAPTRVRRHTTREGFVILVGRSGAENDGLTFRVASPWDFWLHASGLPGAHVVVRNPKRAPRLPESTLQTAAEIAAYYSGARENGKVEVHYTQRKYVRKRKGAPPGEVLLRRFRSIQVTPRLPSGALEES